MKTKLLIVIILLVSNAIYAQDISKNNESKAEKALQIAKEYRNTEKLIDNRAFVLTADFLSNRYGYRRITESLLNFIKVDSSQVIIQTGNSFGIGYNGVGGLTLTGRVTKWEVTKDPIHNTFVIRVSISSSLGFYDIFMNVNSSGKAIATITGMSRGDLTFEGSLHTLSEARTFEGTDI